MAVGTIDVAEVGPAEDGDVFIYRFEIRRAEPGLYTHKESLDVPRIDASGAKLYNLKSLLRS